MNPTHHRRRLLALLLAMAAGAGLLLQATSRSEVVETGSGTGSVVAWSHHPAPLPSSRVAPHDDSGVVGDERLAAPDAEAALAAAEHFVAQWSMADPHWHQRVSELSTGALARALAAVDPLDPAPRAAGPGVVLFDAPQWARIAVPTDRGQVLLDLVLTGGQWLVAALDWQPA